MRGRRAPSSGYDFGQKRQYRRSVWATFRRVLSSNGRSVAGDQALLLPSSEASEIDVALANGFRERNLHVVDRNPAIIAHVKRRYPRVNSYGCSIGDIGERLVKKGVRLRCANLDLCSQVSTALCDEVGAFVRSGCMEERFAMLAVTTLRGREQRDFSDQINNALNVEAQSKLREFMRPKQAMASLSDNDVQRLLMLKYSATTNEQAAEIYRAEKYRSTAGNQTMLWAVFVLMSKEFCEAIGFETSPMMIMGPGRTTNDVEWQKWES